MVKVAMVDPLTTIAKHLIGCLAEAGCGVELLECESGPVSKLFYRPRHAKVMS
jgi:hypothetical protein